MPQPMRGEPERIVLWAQVITGTANTKGGITSPAI
jgi:hypothetical protein